MEAEALIEEATIVMMITEAGLVRGQTQPPIGVIISEIIIGIVSRMIDLRNIDEVERSLPEEVLGFCWEGGRHSSYPPGSCCISRKCFNSLGHLCHCVCS